MRALLMAGAFSGAFTLLLTPLFIRLFHRLQWGQFIREDGPKSHHVKHGTATMGGIVIIIATVAGYFLGMLFGNRAVAPSALLVLFMMVGLGFVGFIDDFLKIRRRNSGGLNKRGKLLGQLLVGAVFGIIALSDPGSNTETVGSTKISFIRDINWLDIGKVGAIILFVAVVLGATNGVNLTDGLDGLATGTSVMVLGALHAPGMCPAIGSIGSTWPRNRSGARASSRVSAAVTVSAVRVGSAPA